MTLLRLPSSVLRLHRRPLTTVEAIRLGSHILTLRHAHAGWFVRLGDYTFGPYETRRIALTELAVHLDDKGNPQAADLHLRPNNRLDRLLPRRIPTMMKA